MKPRKKQRKQERQFLLKKRKKRLTEKKKRKKVRARSLTPETEVRLTSTCGLRLFQREP